MGGVGMGGRPLAAASAGFLAGAFFGTFWGLALVPLALWRPARFVVLGLLIGSLRGMLQETPRTAALAEEFEAQVVSAGVVRASGELLSLRMRGLEVHRGDRVRIYGQVHEPAPRLNPGGRDRRAGGAPPSSSRIGARPAGMNPRRRPFHLMCTGPQADSDSMRFTNFPY